MDHTSNSPSGKQGTLAQLIGIWMVVLGGVWLFNELAQLYLPQIWWVNLLLAPALCLSGALWWRRLRQPPAP